MSTNLPWQSLMGAFYGLSETALGLFKRARRGSGTTSADRGSLLAIWLVILVSLSAAMAMFVRLPQADTSLLRRLYVPGILLFLVGLGLRWSVILHLGRFFTVDVAIASDHRVVDTGPYRWVRHPSYSGALLAFAGFGICLGNWISLVVILVPVTAAFLWRIALEEKALVAALGGDYLAYARRTRRLVPFVY